MRFIIVYYIKLLPEFADTGKLKFFKTFDRKEVMTVVS